MAQDSKQEAIKTALTAMEILRDEGLFVEEMKKLLPPFALRQMNQGQEITLEYILKEARLGVENLKAPRADTSSKPLVYEEVVADLKEIKTPERLLIEAIKNENIEEIKQLASSRAVDIDSVVDAMIEVNNLEMMKEHINITPGRYFEQSLILAAKKGRYEIVKHLVEKNVSAKGDDLIQAAVRGENIEILKLLTEKQGEDYSINTAVVAAAKIGRMDMIEHLLSCPYGQKMYENIETNAMCSAAENGHLPVIKYMFERDFENAFVATKEAIISAANNGHLDIVRYLIEEIKAKCSYQDILNLAVYSNRMDVIKYIVEEKKAKVGHEYGHVFTFACQKGDTETLKYLLSKNRNKEVDYELFFWAALDRGHLDFAKLLFDKKKFELKNKERIKKSIDKSITDDDLVRFEYLVEKLIVTGIVKLDEKTFAYVCSRLGKLNAWRKTAKIDPPLGLNDSNPHIFNAQTFYAVQSILQKEGYVESVMSNNMAFKTATFFKTEENVLKYLQRWGEKGKQPLHDIIQHISIPKKFEDHDIWFSAVMQCGPSMARLVKFADRIKPAKNDKGDAWSYQNTRAEAAKFSYKKASENIELATICFDHLVDEEDFNDALTLTKKRRAKKNLPDITIEGTEFNKPEYKFRMLNKDDPRGLFLGKIVDCCQSLDGQGKECAKHGFTSKNSGFYVVENEKGKIIGETWAWRGKNNELVFDSLETLGENLSDNNWSKLVTAFSKALENKTVKHNVSELILGTGGETPTSLTNKFNKSASAEPIDYAGYRDSHKQVQVWKAKVA